MLGEGLVESGLADAEAARDLVGRDPDEAAAEEKLAACPDDPAPGEPRPRRASGMWKL